MFLWSKPSESWIRSALSRQSAQKFSYVEVGASAGQPPPHYATLRGRIDLGEGPQIFERAMLAVQQWKMFEVPGVELCWPDAPIETGTTVAILIKHFGFWSLNFCRIVYTVNEDEGQVCRFGFAYGTLREHAESGEERFLVEWNRDSNRVSYDILSFSRPGSAMTWAGYPLARWLQGRFIRESLAAMVRTVKIGEVTGQ